MLTSRKREHDQRSAISGGANDGAHVQRRSYQLRSVSDLGGRSARSPARSNSRSRGDFTGTARCEVRPFVKANTGQSASITTKQPVDGTDANNLAVQLNETNTSNVTVVTQNVQTDGQGLKLDFAQNAWNDRADIDNAISQLDAAKLTLRAASSALSTNLNIIQTRETFTKEFSDVLTEGANKLTLADQNEEGAEHPDPADEAAVGYDFSVAGQPGAAGHPAVVLNRRRLDRVGRRRQTPPPASLVPIKFRWIGARRDRFLPDLRRSPTCR